MTKEYQKNTEIFYAENTGELLGELWKVESAPDEENWPDLLVSTGKEKFGLEVREIYLDETNKGSIKKADESENRKKIQELASLYYKRNLTPIKVDILGDLSDPKKILSSIINSVHKLSTFGQKKIDIKDDCTIFIDRLPDQMGEYKMWNYITDKVGWVESINKETIDKFITMKAKKLEKYSKNITDVRLLLVGDRFYNSGRSKLPYGDDLKFDKQGFTEVYYLSYPESVIKLKS